MSKGLSSLTRRLEELERVVSQPLAASPQATTSLSLATATVASPQTDGFDDLLRKKQEIEAARLQRNKDMYNSMIEDYKRGLPQHLAVSANGSSTVTDLVYLGDAIDYAVEFVEDHTEEFMSVIDGITEDKSKFKLVTAIQLLSIAMPGVVTFSELLLTGLINTIVKHKYSASGSASDSGYAATAANSNQTASVGTPPLSPVNQLSQAPRKKRWTAWRERA